MNKKSKILIVEDEVAIRTGLVDVFVYHGYDVSTAENGQDGLREALSGKYDLILLDVMLPFMDGFEICGKIREQDRDQPIIMLTAKSSDEDIIQGLRLGADDYVAKPFSVAQLVLRVQAVLKRSRKIVKAESSIMLANGLIIDVQNLSACIVDRANEKVSNGNNKNSVSFTRREMDVLEYLFLCSDRPVPREELLSKVWGYREDMEIETRTVDIHIAKLRRKIENDPKNPAVLLTVRGAGYKLDVCSDA
ncbi:MAG: response regulator transcription factor [Cellvibrionaceae bacterium]